MKHSPALRRIQQLPERAPQTKGSILIRDRDMHPLFVLDIYGVTTSDLCMCPGGGALVVAALRRAKIDPSKVYFTIWDVII